MKEVRDPIISVLVVAKDGLVVDILTREREKSEEKKFMGAFGALVEVVLKRLTKDFELGTFGAGTFDTDKYRFIFCEAGPDHLLVAILDSMTLIDAIFPHTYLVADKAARIIEDRPASPVIPELRTSPKYRELKKKFDAAFIPRKFSSEYIYKLVLIGDGSVGKTSMVQMYVHGIFPESYKATIGTFITKKTVDFTELDTSVRLLIWDLAGQEQFKRIWPDYMQDANAGIIVFDLTDRDTFDHVRNWYEQIKEVALPNVILILAGNKMDLEDKRIISTEEGEALAEELGIYYMETSAKDDINLDKIFEYICLELIGEGGGMRIQKREGGIDHQEINLSSKYVIDETQIRQLYSLIKKQLEVSINKTEMVRLNKMVALLKEIEENKL